MASMKAARVAATVLVVGAVARPAHAGEGRSRVLLLCNEDVLDVAGEGCPSLAAALGSELADFDVGIELVPWSGAPIPEGKLVPPVVAALHAQRGGIFSAWLSRSDTGILTAHVYDTGNEQTISRVLGALGAEGLGLPEVAFHLRLIMGASLYSELEKIVEDEDLMALAVPEERMRIIANMPKEPVPERRTRLRIHLGYLLLGYPTADHWFHGFATGVALVPVGRLEILLEGSAAFTGERARSEAADVTLHNTQIDLGLGLGYEILMASWLGVLPLAGFRLGISHTDVREGDGRRTVDRVNPILQAGLDLRFYVHERIAIHVGTRLDFLFRYQVFDAEVDGSRVDIYELARFRFGATAGFSVVF
jgi:hypothetical protein